MQVWLGHAVSLFSFRPELLSTFDACYRFVENNVGRRAFLLREVMQEMRFCAALVWLIEVCLDAPFVPHVSVGDSSTEGYGLVYKYTSRSSLAEAWGWKEK